MANIMGTRFDILIIGESRANSEAVWIRLSAELTRLDRMLDRFDPASEISLINRRAAESAVEISGELWYILQSCKRYHEMTLGLFDVTKRDFSSVRFNEGKKLVSFPKSGTSFDLGGFAKGYALGKLKAILLQEQVKQSFVDFGNSSILGLGAHPYGDSWKVSLENPFCAGEILEEIPLRDEALSVSGNTPRYTAHIVHPFSGKPIEARKSVCVVAENPLDAEVLTTALMVASPDEKKQILKHFNVKKTSEYNLI